MKQRTLEEELKIIDDYFKNRSRSIFAIMIEEKLKVDSNETEDN